MAAIVAIFRESKMAIIALGITMVVLGTVIAVALFSGGEEPYVVEGAGISYTDVGSFEFEQNAEVIKKWDNSSEIEGTATVPGAPLLYDDGTVVITEPSTVVFPDTSDVVLLDQYSEIKTNGNQYSITNDEDGKEIATNEMVVKTLSNFYIFITSGATVTANGTEIIKDAPVIVTQMNEDGSVTLYGEINQTFLAESFIVTTPAGKVNFDDLIYDAEIDTDLAAITISGNEIDQLAYENNGIIESNSQEDTTIDDGATDEGTSDEVAATQPVQDTNSTSNTSSDVSNENNTVVVDNGESDSSDAASGSSIFGLKDFFEDLFNSNSSVTPEVNVVLTPGYSTVTADIDVFDPSNAIQGKMNAYLYDENKNLITFKEFDPAEKVTISFDSLESETSYIFEIEASYTTSKNEEYTGIFYSSMFTTSRIALDVKVIQQLSDSFTLNVKVPDESITYARFEVYKNDSLGSEYIGEYEVNIDEALTSEGYNMKVSGLESNTTYTVNLVEMTVEGESIEGDQSLLVSTLKLTPTVSAPIVYPEPLESLFKVISPEINDPDNSIDTLNYEVWEVDATGNKTYITSIEKTAQNMNEYANIYVDGDIIKRNTTYQFRVVAEGFDNLHYYKVESEFSGNYIMSGIEPPVAIFSYDMATDITFNSIMLDVEIVDLNGAIVGSPVLEIYKGADKLASSYTLAPGDNLDLTFDGLTANTTYTLQVVADVDLQDGEGIRQDIIIGTVYITTNVIEEMEMAYVIDAQCPPGVIEGTYTSCVTETGATIQISSAGEALPYLETASVKIIEASTGAPVYSIPLNPQQITELTSVGTTSVVIPEGVLNSNTQYRIELYQVTDGANNMPFVVTTADFFYTKKMAPTAVSFDAVYDADLEVINTEMTDYTDVDDSFVKVTYNLYEASAVIGTDSPVATIVNADPSSIDVYFEVDGVDIPRGNRYVVEAQITYNNNYFEEIYTLPLSSEIFIEFATPYIELSDILVTYNDINVTLTVVDEDLIIPSGSAVIELKDSTGAVVGTANVPVNTPTPITFTNLTSNSQYSLTCTTEVGYVDGIQSINILDYGFMTGVDPSEYPFITLDSLNLNDFMYVIEYASTLNDPNSLTQSVSLVFTENATGEEITTREIAMVDDNTGTPQLEMVGDVDYTIEDILKNMEYSMTAVASWTDVLPATLTPNTEFKMVDQYGNALTLFSENGVDSIINPATPQTGSVVTFEPIVGFQDEYKIKLNGADKYLSTNTNGDIIVSDKAASKTYVVEEVAGVLYLKDKSSGLYIGPNYTNTGYSLVDKDNACQFTLYTINETVSAPLTMMMPPAPMPVYEEVSLTVSDTGINISFNILDPFDLINSDTMLVTLYDESLNEVTTPNATCEPDQINPCSIEYTDLDALTMYTLSITGTVNLDQKNSLDQTDFMIYEKGIQTEPTPPKFTTVSAAFDPINRTINISTDLSDPSDIYSGYSVGFLNGTTVVSSVPFTEQPGVVSNTIAVPLSLVPAAVKINSEYTISVTYTSDIYSDSETITTLSPLPLTLNQVTASVLVSDITDTSMVVSGTISDEHLTLLGDLTLRCVETNDPSQEIVVPLGIGSFSYTFTNLKPATSYNIYIDAEVDSDGRGTITTENIYTQTNVYTVDKLPEFVGMIATYDGVANEVVVQMFNGVETQKINSVDILVEDLDGVVIGECAGATHTATYEFTYCPIPETSLIVGTPYNVTATFNYTLENTTTGSIKYSAMMVPTQVLKVTSEDGQLIMFDQEVEISYYENGSVLESTTSNEVNFVNGSEYAVVTTTDGSEFTFYNTKYVAPNNHGKQYYRFVPNEDGVGMYIPQNTSVEIVNTSYKVSPFNIRNTEVYTSETIDEFSISTEEIQNYSVQFIESEKE